MDKDKELIAKYAAKDDDLRKLVEQHRALDERLEEFHRRPYLTSEEEQEKKRIQVQKLALKDQIMAIVEKYKKMEEGRG